MPRCSVLTPAERLSLLTTPATDDELIRHYTLSESDTAVIQQHRDRHNRLGFAVQRCSPRHPGSALPTDSTSPTVLLCFVAQHLHLDPALWSHYAQGAQQDLGLAVGPTTTATSKRALPWRSAN